MRHLRVLTIINEQKNICIRADIRSSNEDWKLSINCQEPDNTDREQTLITINLPNKTTFSGTIQNVQAIRNIAWNALQQMKQAQEDRIYEFNNCTEEIDNCIAELSHLISLFK